MRNRLTSIIAVVVVVAGALWLLFREGTPGPVDVRSAAGQGESGVRAERPTVASALQPWRPDGGFAARPSGTKSIHGHVLNGTKPVAGATVTATRGEDGEALSTRDCECGNHCGQRLLECGCGESAQQLVELVSQRRGEVVPIAETVSDGDGAFTIENLDDGAVALWASGESRLVGVVRDVSPGAEGVEIRLDSGRILRGDVVDEDGAPLAGVALTAVNKDESRFFDTLSDGQGRFSLGPVPGAPYRVVAWDGKHLADQADFDAGEEEKRIVLTDPRTLSGHVLLDGAPVGGAALEVTGEHRTEHATSAADGRFAISGLRRGKYLVRATSGTRGGEANADLNPREGAVVDVVLGTLGAIAGTVRDDRGNPIKGAKISASGAVRSRDAETSAEGTFQLSLPAGEWSISASHKGFRSKGNERSVVVSAEETTTADFVLPVASVLSGVVVDVAGKPIPGAFVRAGEGFAMTRADGLFRLDLRAGPTKLTIHHEEYRNAEQQVTVPATDVRVTLERGLSLSGSVVDADGKPVAEAPVSVGLGGSELTFGGGAESGRDGRFVVHGLSPGKGTVTASMKDGASTLSTSVPVVLGASDLDGVVLRFARGGTISGVVVSEAGAALEGVPLEARPLTGADVTGEDDDEDDLDDDPLSGETLRTISAAGGRFQLQHASSARYGISVSGNLYTQSKVAEAAPGAVGVRVVVSHRASVRGRVVDGAGQPIAAFALDTRPYSSADGTFEHPIDRDFTPPLVVSAAGHASVERDVQVTPHATVELGDIVLPEGRTIAGLVVDGRTGAPVGGAKIVLNPGLLPDVFRRVASQTPAAGTTSSSGRFTLDHVRQGEEVVAVIHPAYGTTLATIGASESAPTLRLTMGPSIVGRVIGADGAGLRAKLSCVDEATKSFEMASSDANGDFRIANLAPGTYRLDAMFGSDVGLDPATVVVPEAGEVQVELHERSGPATLLITLATASGASPTGYVMLFPGVVEAAEIRAAGSRALQPSEMRVGWFLFRGIPLGHYTAVVTSVSTTSRTAQFQLEPVDVTSAGEHTLDIALDPTRLHDASELLGR